MKYFRLVLLTSIMFTLLSISSISVHADKPVTAEMLFELDTGSVLYTKNADDALPVGVLNKLMTVLVAADAVEKGEISLSDTAITPASASIKGASVWLENGDTITVEELFRAVIIGNANDAAETLAYHISRDENVYNERVKAISTVLNLTSASFTNTHGFLDPGEQIASAADMAKILSALSKIDFLKKYFTTTLDYVRDGSAQLVNSNRLVRVFKGTIGYKFGYSKESGYCLASAAERDGSRYGVILLGFDDEDDMYERAKALLNNGFNAYTTVMPQIPEDLPRSVPVKGALVEELPLAVKAPRKIIIHKGDVDNLETVTALPDYIYAPAHRGDNIGVIDYYLNGEVIYRLSIVSAEDTPKLNFGNNLSLMLMNCFSFG